MSPSISNLTELAGIFLRLGLTAFGGPAAHIALMKEEFVMRRQWLTEAEFLDLLGAVNLIPGPNSTELAIHIGLRRAGFPGLLIAGVCFILPAALTVLGIAWAYVHFGTLPDIQGVLFGVKPVVLAVVAQAIAGLVKPALKTRLLIFIAVVVLALSLAGVNELLLLFGAGCALGLLRWSARPDAGAKRPSLWPLVALLILAGLATLLVPRSTGTAPIQNPSAIFLFFLKVGSVLYGSGYVLLAFLRDGLVGHGLTEAQLLDAVAVGQVTPGPVFTTATFVGYVLGHGPASAVLATLGIFLPSFVFVGLSHSLIPHLRQSPVMSAFLDGVNVAALSLMVSVLVMLGRTTLTNGVSIALALVSAVLLLRFKVSSAWLLVGAAILGWLINHFGAIATGH
jgi:chromate transporter